MSDSALKASIGGLYGINVETLGADKTLTPGVDKIYQYLDEGGADRIITLDTGSATAGDRFFIRHNGVYSDARYLEVKQGATSLHKIYSGAFGKFIFDGTNWAPEGIGSGENDTKKYNLTIGVNAIGRSSGMGIGHSASGWNFGVAIGRNTRGDSNGAAVGYSALGYDMGVAIGYEARGYTDGVGIGYFAEGHTFGVAVGYRTDTNSKRYSIALGYRSECERVGETSINIDAQTDQENNVVQGRWAKTTTDATPVEIFCAAYSTSRFTIRPSSALAFRMTIVARDNVSNHVAMYTVVDGLIKRDGANNTVMSNCTVTVVHEDDVAWDVAVTADDGNEALIITVTGDPDNPTQWAAVMDGVETHF